MQGIPGPKGDQGLPGPAAAIPDPVAVPPGVSTTTNVIHMDIPDLDGPNSDRSFTVGFGQLIMRRPDGSLAWSTAISVPFDDGSPQLHLRASNGTPFPEMILHLFKGTSGRAVVGLDTLDITLRNVTITKLVGGTESCSTSSGCTALPVDTLYVAFNKIEVKHGSQSGDKTATYDLTNNRASPSLDPSELADSFNLVMGSGATGFEHASSFTGPTQTPDGTFAKAGLDPLEANQDDPGIDRRLVRFLALVTGTPIPSGHVKVSGSTGHLLRSYDMGGIRFAQASYSGLKEDLSFSVDSMKWTAGTQSSTFP